MVHPYWVTFRLGCGGGSINLNIEAQISILKFKTVCGL
jgi:hypothetical protein